MKTVIQVALEVEQVAKLELELVVLETFQQSPLHRETAEEIVLLVLAAAAAVELEQLVELPLVKQVVLAVQEHQAL
jgi:hypothetical protein